MTQEPGPPRHKQLHHWVADRVRDDILDGRLRPGEWLRQEHLAQEHGVSETPVREALKQLASEGLVDYLPYRGVRVVQFSCEDVEDLYSSRSVVEGMAARHAAARITEEELAGIVSCNDEMLRCRTPEDLDEYRELNRRFHLAVIAASRRPYLIRTLEQLWSAFPTMLWSIIPRTATTSAPGRDEPDAAEHAEILAALGARDRGRAERAVRRHIRSAGKALVAAMREQG